MRGLFRRQFCPVERIVQIVKLRAHDKFGQSSYFTEVNCLFNTYQNRYRSWEQSFNPIRFGQRMLSSPKSVRREDTAWSGCWSRKATLPDMTTIVESGTEGAKGCKQTQFESTSMLQFSSTPAKQRMQLNRIPIHVENTSGGRSKQRSQPNSTPNHANAVGKQSSSNLKINRPGKLKSRKEKELHWI